MKFVTCIFVKAPLKSKVTRVYVINKSTLLMGKLTKQKAQSLHAMSSPLFTTFNILELDFLRYHSRKNKDQILLCVVLIVCPFIQKRRYHKSRIGISRHTYVRTLWYLRMHV